MNAHPSKKDLRQKLIDKIEAIPFTDLISKSGNLSARFQAELVQRTSFLQFSGNYVVSFYPFGSEPQLNIEEEGQKEPYRVSYVRIQDWKSRKMDAAEARRDQPGQWEEIELSPDRKIYQPGPNQNAISSEKICMILVPGLGFSKEGCRLGRGAGFYDRFLKRHPLALRVGIAFEEQVVDELPTDDWDEKIDVILTDQRIYEVNSMNLLGRWKSQGKVEQRSI